MGAPCSRLLLYEAVIWKHLTRAILLLIVVASISAFSGSRSNVFNVGSLKLIESLHEEELKVVPIDKTGRG
ncbi:hypothetical protein ASF49_12715 [Methylobacterium sp. Leaf104]|nr:hypothetical protein ASF49_12715 [Methylobacterium sp. Leaf104]